MRVQPAAAPARVGRASGSPTSTTGASAVRALSQSGLHPANCRLLDPAEAALTGAGDGSRGAARARLRVGRPRRRAVDVGARCECCARPRRRRGSARPAATATAGDAVGSWREAFLRAPYLRDTLVAIGVLSETFETAITWDRVPGVPRRGDRARRRAAVAATPAATGAVTCRFTHVYPDGPAPYYTVLAPARARRRARAVGRRSSAPPRTR